MGKRVQGLHDPVASMKQDPQSIGRQLVEAPQELMRMQLVQRHIQQEVKPPQTRSKRAIMQVLVVRLLFILLFATVLEYYCY
jgi:hypothetical protein